MEPVKETLYAVFLLIDDQWRRYGQLYRSLETAYKEAAKLCGSTSNPYFPKFKEAKIMRCEALTTYGDWEEIGSEAEKDRPE